MVVGNGMIATAFSAYQKKADVLIFASGVSNSSNSLPDDFIREKLLLQQAQQRSAEATLIYFSTCSIYDKSLIGSAYVQHKLEMEELIKAAHKSFIIFRLSNPVGQTRNQNTLINFFAKCIRDGTGFDVWEHAERNIIDMSHVALLCSKIIDDKLFSNATVNVANPINYSLPYIVQTLETCLQKKAICRLVSKAGKPVIDIRDIRSLIIATGLRFDEKYLPHLIRKYFAVL